MLLSGPRGFLLDPERAWEEKGDMTFLRSLGVVATVAALTAACGTEDDDAGLSNASASQSASASESSSGGASSSSGVASSSGGTTETPTSTGDSSTGDPSTSSPTTDPTTGTATTGDGTTSGTTTGNQGGCGNGSIEGNEQCDGANLNGFTCEALGNAGGTLQCDPVTCTFDTQMCDVGGTGGTSG